MFSYLDFFFNTVIQRIIIDITLDLNSLNPLEYLKVVNSTQLFDSWGGIKINLHNIFIEDRILTLNIISVRILPLS